MLLVGQADPTASRRPTGGPSMFVLTKLEDSDVVHRECELETIETLSASDDESQMLHLPSSRCKSFCAVQRRAFDA